MHPFAVHAWVLTQFDSCLVANMPVFSTKVKQMVAKAMAFVSDNSQATPVRIVDLQLRTPHTGGRAAALHSL